jgi:hypothetical protein
MSRRNALLVIVLAILWPATGADAGEGRLSGFAAVETRLFVSSPAFADQNRSTFSPSFVLQPEYRHTWDGGADRVTVAPFLRLDADDDHRSHADMRELNWLHKGGDWDLLTGVGKVFWGVAESRHLVDIINQTDLVENIDGEDKLGQPMVNLNLIRDWGTFGLFVMPRFRERTFPDRTARLRGAAPVATGDPVFESGAEQWHVDFALRWWHAIGDLDIGIAHFRGTGREPRLVAGSRGGTPVFVPHYDQIDQTGLDAQYTTGAWLLKLETITRAGNGDRFAALVAGFEYTFFGLAGSSADLGILAEYLYDGRDETAPPTSSDDDIFLAARLTLNDVQSTTVLAGAVVDRDTQATFLTLEAARRLGDTWKAEIEYRGLVNVPATDPMAGGLRRDDHLLINLSRFF